MLGSIIHPMTEPGTYRASVQRDGREVGHFHVSVEEGAEQLQANLDLSRAERRSRGGAQTGGKSECDCGQDEGLRLTPGGHLLLHVSEGPGGYSVVLASGPVGKQSAIYDSTVMAEGDRFAATVLRPGRYSVTNLQSKASGKLDVAYPERGDRPYVPENPVTVVVTAKSIRPASLSVGAAQGQIYEVRAPSRIRIDLLEPHDRPRQKGPRYRLAREPARPRQLLRDIQRGKPKQSSRSGKRTEREV